MTWTAGSGSARGPPTTRLGSDTSLAFQSVLYLYYEAYNGNILRCFHSNGASIVFLWIAGSGSARGPPTTRLRE